MPSTIQSVYIVKTLQQPNRWNMLKYYSLMTPPTIHLFPRGAPTTSVKCSLSWIDKHWTCYLSSVCLDQKAHESCAFGIRVAWTIRQPESACSSNNLMQNPNRSQNPKSKTRNPKSKIQNTKSKIRNPKSQIQNPKSKIQTAAFGGAT